jgi:hypothetical protein
VRVLLLVAVLLLTIPGVAGARGGQDVRAIRALLQKQLTLVKQGKFRAMYATTTKRFRSRCPYARWVRNMKEIRRILGPTAQVDRILVRFVSARQAIVSYRFLKRGRPFLRVRFSDGDRYAKIGARWFDEYDRIAC